MNVEVGITYVAGRRTRFRHWLGNRIMRLGSWVYVGIYADPDPSCDCGNCGYACAYVEPYGFVPEAGCPIHDPND